MQQMFLYTPEFIQQLPSAVTLSVKTSEIQWQKYMLNP
uniref:Uncharacterized protein n=1 Tax=Anguilla anguilla TaxID=7936 RepID=A0A0E9SCW9_ANGAN